MLLLLKMSRQWRRRHAVVARQREAGRGGASTAKRSAIANGRRSATGDRAATSRRVAAPAGTAIAAGVVGEARDDQTRQGKTHYNG